MKCKNCGKFIHVKHSYVRKDGTISRRRVCTDCKIVYDTIEVNRKEYVNLKRLSIDLRYSVERYIEGRKHY